MRPEAPTSTFDVGWVNQIASSAKRRVCEEGLANVPNPELSQKVAAVAARLMLLQTSQADESPDVRREHIAEIVRRAIADLPPAQREAFLVELEARFPSWDSNVEVVQTTPAPVRSGVDEAELKNPAFLVARLVEAWGGLADVQRRVLIDRLREGGVVPKAEGASWPEKGLERLVASLEMPAGALPHPDRMIDLVLILAEFAAALDQLVWNQWRAIAQRSTSQRPPPLKRTAGQFLSGSSDVGRQQVAQDAERLRRLTAALVSAMKQAGTIFAQRYQERFSVSAIKAAAGRGGLVKGQSALCWEVYENLASQYDEEAISTDIIKAIVEYVQRIMESSR